MRCRIPLVLLLLATTSASGAELALKRVTLSTAGVGYYEYEAEIADGAELQLKIRRDQVDDALKSLVVYDSAGRVARVSLPGQDSENALFRELPFQADTLTALPKLLEALRGAEIQVGGAQALQGRVIAVMAEQPGTTGAVQRHRVSVLTGTGIRQFVLEEAESLRFSDPALQAQLQRALEGVARLADRERRTLSIQLDGAGARTVRVGFVAGAPLWKATYRAMLPADPAAKTARLQGWAVLENESGEDWKGVDLTLVSGNPVTFRQALYAPFHVDRPIVPVEVWGRVMPVDPDRGAAPSALMSAAPAPVAVLRSGGQLGRLERGQASSSDMSAETLVRMAPQQADIVASGAVDGQTQISFRVPGSISVRNGDSMMVPLIAQEVPAERVALFRAERGRHPLASLRLQNAGTMPLPPGVLAIFAQGADGAAEFIGDARLAPLPAGESRLVSYAVDYKTRVEVVPASTARIDRMRALDGVLTVVNAQRRSIDYAVTTAPGEPRQVLIEEPAPVGGWRTVTPAAQEISRGDGIIRVALAAPGGQISRLEVAHEQTIDQRVALAQSNVDQIAVYMRGPLTDAQKQALDRLRELMGKVAGDGDKLRGAEERQRGLVEEQKRVRDNLGVATGELQRRYREQMASLEDRIVAAREEAEAARRSLDAGRAALRDYAQKLSF
jgi:hypothetical protein